MSPDSQILFAQRDPLPFFERMIVDGVFSETRAYEDLRWKTLKLRLDSIPSLLILP